MIGTLIDSGIETLITQGTGWVIAVILGAWAVTLDKRVVAMQAVFDGQFKDANKAVQDQYEKRLTEFRELLEVMSNSTNTIKAMHGSLTANSEAINQLAQGFSKLMEEFEGQQEYWEDRGGAMARQLDDVRIKLENLQREVQGK